MRTVELSRLPYTEATNKKYRDLRQLEVRLPKNRWSRVSLNGQYRGSHSSIRATKQWNPGWSWGTERFFINWTHFKRHCWHLAFNFGKRGITFSDGKSLF